MISVPGKVSKPLNGKVVCKTLHSGISIPYLLSTIHCSKSLKIIIKNRLLSVFPLVKVARGYFLGTEVLFSKSSFGHVNLNRFF